MSSPCVILPTSIDCLCCQFTVLDAANPTERVPPVLLGPPARRLLAGRRRSRRAQQRSIPPSVAYESGVCRSTSLRDGRLAVGVKHERIQFPDQTNQRTDSRCLDLVRLCRSRQKSSTCSSCPARAWLSSGSADHAPRLRAPPLRSEECRRRRKLTPLASGGFRPAAKGVQYRARLTRARASRVSWSRPRSVAIASPIGGASTRSVSGSSGGQSLARSGQAPRGLAARSGLVHLCFKSGSRWTCRWPRNGRSWCDRTGEWPGWDPIGRLVTETDQGLNAGSYPGVR